MRPFPLFISTALLFIFGSCATLPRYTLYVPNTINTPLIKGAGDYNATACIGLVGGFQAQASYSPLSHFLILTNGMNNLLISKDDTTTQHTRNYELGLGCYFQIAEDKNKKIQLNIAAGYGEGYCFDKYTVHAHSLPLFIPDTIYRQQLNSTYIKYFVQPSIDIIKPQSTISFSIKTSINDIQVNTTAPYVPNSPLNGSSSHLLPTMEFAITWQHRYSGISTYMQYKILFPTNGDEYNRLVTNDGASTAQAMFAFTFGITLNSKNMHLSPMPSQGYYNRRTQ